MELKTYVAQDSTGAIISGATAALFVNGTDTLATGLVDAADAPLDNPMVADKNGIINFKAPNGIYQLQFSLGPLPGPRFTIQLLDLNQQLAETVAVKDQAEALLTDAKSIVQMATYPTTTEAMADAKLPEGSYFRVPGNMVGSNMSAFVYYRKLNGNATLVATIPNTAQVQAMNTAMQSKLEAAVFKALVQTVDESAGATDLLYCVRDSLGYQTWLGVSVKDGGPSAWAEKVLRDRLKISVASDFMADGEQISWAVTDKDGNLTDLAVRAFDGQLADFAVRRIGDRILTKVNQSINSQLDPMKMSRDATGFPVLASCTRWGAQRARGESVTSPINFKSARAQRDVRLTFNGTHSNDGPMLLVIYFGGVGSGASLTPPPEYAAAMADGIVWARCNYGGLDHYGAPVAMTDVADVYSQACKMAPIGGVILLGNSMGGMGALNALLTGVVPGVLGLYLTDPVCNLWDRYNSTRQDLIKAAYGINANGTDYSTKTAGYDPVLRNWTDFKGAPVYCIASTGDDLVPMATNAQQLYDTFGHHLDFTLDTHTTAGHNTADRFDVAAFRSFISKCCNGSILKS